MKPCRDGTVRRELQLRAPSLSKLHCIRSWSFSRQKHNVAFYWRSRVLFVTRAVMRFFSIHLHVKIESDRDFMLTASRCCNLRQDKTRQDKSMTLSVTIAATVLRRDPPSPPQLSHACSHTSLCRHVRVGVGCAKHNTANFWGKSKPLLSEKTNGVNWGNFLIG